MLIPQSAVMTIPWGGHRFRLEERPSEASPATGAQLPRANAGWKRERGAEAELR